MSWEQNEHCSFVACFSVVRDLMFVYSFFQINWYWYSTKNA